ncbi:MAG TPA: hypothetical protein H9913_07240 [Candidatus Blautia stercoripullorum]|uniref:Uncharacterized protein n=1 Tax=Candidatus Blautia stercoripullorum TaxID=2838502 RepID=A0A9D2RA22_9FIRM|nr:hypothetical protein [Candidatus Blautia stercoripullorum]
MFGKNPRILKPGYCTCGVLHENGKRYNSDWKLSFKAFSPVYSEAQVASGKLITVRLSSIVAEHFPRQYIPEEYKDEPIENHHCTPKSFYAPDQGREANRASNMRQIPATIHKKLTKLQNKTFEQEQQAINEAIANKTQIETEPGTLESLLKVLLILGVEPESAVLQTYSQNGETDFIDITRNINLLFKGSPSEGQPIKFNSDTGEVIVCGIPGKVKNWEKLSDARKKEWREKFAYINYQYIKAQEQQEGGEE